MNGLWRQKSERVDFERGIHAYIVWIDGTWRRDCMMVDVSQTGARLRVEGSLDGLDLKSSSCICRRQVSHIAAVAWYDSLAIKSASGFWRETRTPRKKPPQNSGPRTKSLETIPDFGPLIDAIQPVWPTYRTCRSLSLRRSSKHVCNQSRGSSNLRFSRLARTPTISLAGTGLLYR